MISRVLLSLLVCSEATATPQAIDTADYLHRHKWILLDDNAPLKSPVPGVAPLWFHTEDNPAPRCGLLIASHGGKAPSYIELVGSDPEVGFPQCIGIKSMKAFKMQNKEYLAVEYLSRETREDTDVRFHYLTRNRAGSFTTDNSLTDAVPSTPSGMHPTRPMAVKTVDGVRQARIAHLRQAYPAWRFSDRDFISDNTASFSIFEDKKTRRCQFVTEAGAAPLAVAHTTFAAASCDGVLASSRYERAGKVYYLALFQLQGGRRMVGISSVSADGSIAIEKPLSDTINGNGATADMKTAKAALVRQAP